MSVELHMSVTREVAADIAALATRRLQAGASIAWQVVRDTCENAREQETDDRAGSAPPLLPGSRLDCSMCHRTCYGDAQAIDWRAYIGRPHDQNEMRIFCAACMIAQQQRSIADLRDITAKLHGRIHHLELWGLPLGEEDQ
jgi:hypothetical protein